MKNIHDTYIKNIHIQCTYNKYICILKNNNRKKRNRKEKKRENTCTQYQHTTYTCKHEC